MPKSSYIQTNFTAGEQSPRLRSRVDISKYANGARTLENFIVLAHGGIEKRPGTVFTAETRDSTKVSRVIPFEFSTTQAYTLEFGHKYIRFFQDNGQILDTAVITGATQANPCVITAFEHGFLNGDKITITAVVGMTELNGNTYTVANAALSTFELSSIDSTGFTAYSSAGVVTGPYSIQSPYLESELFELQHAQSADVMWIVHKNVKAQKLSRTGHTDWTLTPYQPTADPFVDSTPVTISGATQANPCVITSTLSHGLVTGARVTIRNVVGMTELNDLTYVITFLTTTTFSLDGIDSTLFTAYSSVGNAYSSSTEYPVSVTFFEQRLLFGGTGNEPQKIWSTVSADYEDMTVGTGDDDAFIYVIASGKVNAILWMTGVNRLLIGTSGAEYQASGGNNPITPTNISITRQTNYKSAQIQPVEIDNNALFVQGSRRKVREMAFDDNIGGYVASDLTILSEHITGTGIVEIDYKREPDPTVWAVRDDGQLVGMTYEKAQEVIGWHRHITLGSFESVCVIPTATGDQLWVVVKRTINSATVRYIEYFHAADWVDQEDVFYLDSGLTYDSTPVTTITGLEHLEGETVRVLTDGAEHPDRIVTNGEIELQGLASVVHVGLKYTAKFENLEPEGGNPAGTSQGKIKSWSQLILRVFETMGGTVNGDIIPYKTTSIMMDAPPPLFTGDLSITHQSSSVEALITVTHDTPFPMTLLSYMGNLTVQNG